MMYMCDKSDVRAAYKKGEKRGFLKGIKEAVRQITEALRKTPPQHVFNVCDYTGKEVRIIEVFSTREGAETMVCNLLRKHGGKASHYGIVERTLRPV